MEIMYCIVERDIIKPNVKLHIERHPSPNDLESKETKKGLASFKYLQSIPLTEAKTTVLHKALNFQFANQFAYYLLETVFHWFIHPIVGKRGSKTISYVVIGFNVIVLLCIVYLAVHKQLSKAKHVFAWYAFYSQAIFDSAPPLGVANHSAIKCHMLMAAVPFVLMIISVQPMLSITGSLATVLFGIMPVTLVFALHAFLPYGSMLGLYAAVVYTAAWSIYLTHEAFKKVIVRPAKPE